MQTLLLAVGIVGGSVFVALAGLFWVRRTLPLSFLETHHEVAGFLFGVVGMLYAVLLAFVVFVVWNEFEEAKVTVVREANELGDLFRLAQGFPAPLRHPARQAARDYARIVEGEEWAAMARGETSPRAGEAMDALWRIYGTAEPRTPRENALYAESLTRLGDLSDSRRLRLHDAGDSIPSVVWVELWAGGLTTVLFTYFFGVKSVRSQAWMVAALTEMIAFVLFLVAVLDHPFRGDVRVSAGPFRFVQQRMEEIERHETAAGIALPRTRRGG